MIDLLPPEGRKIVDRSYRLRIGSTFIILAMIVVVLLCVSLVPTYIFTYYQNRAFTLDGYRKSTNTEAYTLIEGALKKTQGELTQLSTTRSLTPVSEVVDAVHELAQSGVTLSHVSVEAPNGVVKSLIVRGTADTRETLAVFADALEASPYFESVQVPISDLARDRQLPFTLEIIASLRSL